jgi:hypothetical protein
MPLFIRRLETIRGSQALEDARVGPEPHGHGVAGLLGNAVVLERRDGLLQRHTLLLELDASDLGRVDFLGRVAQDPLLDGGLVCGPVLLGLGLVRLKKGGQLILFVSKRGVLGS